MKLRKVLSLCMGAALLASCTACGSKQAAAPAENTKAAETSAAKESESKETTAARPGPQRRQLPLKNRKTPRFQH